MGRSNWKGLFFEYSLYRKKEKFSLFTKTKLLKLWCRRSVISSCFLDHEVQVYNGKKFYHFVLKPEMTGMKWGSLVSTRCGGGMGRSGIANVQARRSQYKKKVKKKHR